MIGNTVYFKFSLKQLTKLVFSIAYRQSGCIQVNEGLYITRKTESCWGEGGKLTHPPRAFPLHFVGDRGYSGAVCESLPFYILQLSSSLTHKNRQNKYLVCYLEELISK